MECFKGRMVRTNDEHRARLQSEEKKMTFVKVLRNGEWKLASPQAWPAAIALAVADALRKGGLRVKLCLA